jgi:hypothetical protein
MVRLIVGLLKQADGRCLPADRHLERRDRTIDAGQRLLRAQRCSESLQLTVQTSARTTIDPGNLSVRIEHDDPRIESIKDMLQAFVSARTIVHHLVHGGPPC